MSTARNSALMLLLLGMAGCESPSGSRAPLPTVIVEDQFEIALPAPLPPPERPTEAAQAPPPVVQAAPASPPARAWPANWTNTWISLERWGEFNGLPKPVRLASNPHPKFELSTTNGTLSLKVGSRVAEGLGQEFWLGYAPQFIANAPYIHSVDALKSLQPLVSAARTRSGNRLIVLDPGHGGTDSGARSEFNGHYEKHYTLDWAMRIRALLQARGWRVVLTRNTDTDVPLAERTTIADRAGADLFLSLHFNSGLPNRELTGLETYCLTPPGMPSHLLRTSEDDLEQAFVNNAFDEQNFQLAFQLHRQLLQNTGAADRGVRRARFMAVLRGQNRPAVLIEAGYLSNSAEARRIAQPEYRQKLAEAVAKALD